MSISKISDVYIQRQYFGDTITSIGALHYAGLDLDNMDCGDNGTYGSESFILLKKMDGDNNWYDVVAEC